MSDLGPTATTRQRTLNFRLRLILKCGLLHGPAPRMASLTSKPPSKPVQALKNGVWFANVVLLYAEEIKMSRSEVSKYLHCAYRGFYAKMGKGGLRRMKNKRDRVILGISGAAGGLVGFFGATYLNRLGIGGLDWIYIFLGVIIALYAQIILHETGHLVFGLLSHYKFVSFRVGNIVIYKSQGKMYWGRYRIAGTAGQCLMVPPNMKDGKIPYQLYNFGGAIMNLIVAGIATIVLFLAEVGLLSGTICIAMIFFGIFLAFTNGFPFRFGGIDNDGYNAFSLGENHDSLRAFWIQLKVNEMLTGGMRLKDMPEDWFEKPEEESLENNMIATVAAIRCNRLLDMKAFDEANQEIEWLLNCENGLVGIHERLLQIDQIFCEIFGEQREDMLNGMMEKEMESFIKTMKFFPSILRTQYAYALLVEKDSKKASEIKKKFQKVMEKHPYKGDVESEWELIHYCEDNM